jgi:hypothetical protein
MHYRLRFRFLAYRVRRTMCGHRWTTIIDTKYKTKSRSKSCSRLRNHCSITVVCSVRKCQGIEYWRLNNLLAPPRSDEVVLSVCSRCPNMGARWATRNENCVPPSQSSVSSTSSLATALAMHRLHSNSERSKIMDRWQFTTILFRHIKILFVSVPFALT